MDTSIGCTIFSPTICNKHSSNCWAIQPLRFCIGSLVCRFYYNFKCIEQVGKTKLNRNKNIKIQKHFQSWNWHALFKIFTKHSPSWLKMCFCVLIIPWVEEMDLDMYISPKPHLNQRRIDTRDLSYKIQGPESLNNWKYAFNRYYFNKYLVSCMLEHRWHRWVMTRSIFVDSHPHTHKGQLCIAASHG